MLNEVYVLYQNCIGSNQSDLNSIDIAALKSARDTFLTMMAFHLRHNNIKRAKEMSFEILLFDNYMNDKFLETTKVENIPVQLSVSV